MVDAVQVKKLTIKCDICDFVTEGKPEDWHNKPCPKCGVENIIDDKDMKLYRQMMGMVGMVNGLTGDVKDGYSITVSVDTAEMK